MKKKYFLILIILSVCLSAQPLKIDVRLRLMNDQIISVVVQINNDSEKTINHLEGFINVKDGIGRVLKEERVILIGPSDSPLKDHSTVSRSVKFPIISPVPDYEFHVSKITFTGDYRIYTYHPDIGFYRID